MKKLLLTALASVSLLQPVFASNWVFINTSKVGDSLYIDKDSIRIQGNSFVSAWEKVYSPKFSDGHMKYYVLYDIKNRICEEQRTYIYSNGMNKLQNNEKEEKPVIPDTLEDEALNYILQQVRLMNDDFSDLDKITGFKPMENIK